MFSSFSCGCGSGGRPCCWRVMVDTRSRKPSMTAFRSALNEEEIASSFSSRTVWNCGGRVGFGGGCGGVGGGVGGGCWTKEYCKAMSVKGVRFEYDGGGFGGMDGGWMFIKELEMMSPVCPET